MRNLTGPVATSVLVAGAVLAFDLSMPLGVAGGVPYVVLVLMGIWFPKRRYAFILAAIGTALTLFGYVYSPQGGEATVVAINRLLAIGAIWTTAILLAMIKTSERRLISLNETLEERVEERSHRLLEREHSFRAVTETAQDAILTVDGQGLIRQWNAAACHIFGYEPDEIIGRPADAIIPDRFREAHHNGFSRVVNDPINSLQKGAMELSGLHKDGREIPIELSLSAWNESGERRITAIIRDNTVRHQAEEDLKKALERAEIANHAKSELLANMSHELRTPLNAVIGFADSIEQETFGPLGHDKYREYIHDISNSGKHLLALIGDILDVSALESGALELYETQVDLRLVCDAAVRLVHERANQGNVSLEIDIDSNVADLFADERRIKQILLNLMTNAIKFTPPGGKVCLRVEMTDMGLHRLSVMDTGIGMDDEELKKAMTQFGQIGRGKLFKHEGTGLGLPLSKSLAELHGGDFVIESEKGVGTTVSVIFPKMRSVSVA